VLAIIGFPFLVIGGLYTIAQVRNFTARPDLEVVIVNERGPAVLVVNTSNRIAREPKYGTVLWNLNAGDEKVMEPLPIPTTSGDPIRPGEAWGPNTWSMLPAVKAQLNNGDLVFGWVDVLCPDCAHRRRYWVHFKFGEQGWFAEARTRTQSRRIRRTLARNPAAINTLIPTERRVPIRDFRIVQPE
jgi:hypothetical protein